MENIKNIVSSVIGRMSSGSGVSPKEIQAAWARISTDSSSRVADYKDGCVVISAGSSMRLTRFNLNRENLLKELQKEFPSIVRISFKVASK